MATVNYRNDIRQAIKSTLDAAGFIDSSKIIVGGLYSIGYSSDEIEQMRQNYINGGYGYGHAKQALYEVICREFETERKRFDEFMSDTSLIEEELRIGAEKARKVGLEVLDRAKKKR